MPAFDTSILAQGSMSGHDKCLTLGRVERMALASQVTGWQNGRLGVSRLRNYVKNAFVAALDPGSTSMAAANMDSAHPPETIFRMASETHLANRSSKGTATARSLHRGHFQKFILLLLI